MSSTYEKIVENNLRRFFQEAKTPGRSPLPAKREGDCWHFDAFGRRCKITPDGIFLDDEKENGVLGILVSLYAIHAGDWPLELEPLRAFKEFKDSMPYAGAFTSHTEQILVPHVAAVSAAQARIMEKMGGGDAPESAGGDFRLLVRPLPRIRLCYIFYEADDDFPASATCLYSNNADRFLPIDALADIGEYTSRALIELTGNSS